MVFESSLSSVRIVLKYHGVLCPQAVFIRMEILISRLSNLSWSKSIVVLKNRCAGIKSVSVRVVVIDRWSKISGMSVRVVVVDRWSRISGMSVRVVVVDRWSRISGVSVRVVVVVVSVGPWAVRYRCRLAG